MSNYGRIIRFHLIQVSSLSATTKNNYDFRNCRMQTRSKSIRTIIQWTPPLNDYETRHSPLCNNNENSIHHLIGN